MRNNMWLYNQEKEGMWEEKEEFNTIEDAIKNGREWASKKGLSYFYVGKAEYIEQPTMSRSLLQSVEFIEKINCKEEGNENILRKLKKWQNKKGNTVVHCGKKEEADNLLKMLNKQGFTWVTGDNLIDRIYWDKWESKTCYEISPNRKSVCYGNVSLYLENGYTIRPFSKLFK